jgi:molybdate transport system regulatory protein
MQPRATRRRGQRAGETEQAGEEERRAALTIRVDFGAQGALGPGKVRLLELISKHGSISSAGKEMGMSYRRAWLLVDDLNRMFRQPLVEAQPGGARGGGARLTPLGLDVVTHYRAIERAVLEAGSTHVEALRGLIEMAPRPPQATAPAKDER